jgi:hypothetical protein
LTRSGSGGKSKAFEAAPGLKLALNDVVFLSGLREKINKFEKECGLPE